MDLKDLDKYYKTVKGQRIGQSAYDHEDSPYKNPHILLNKTSNLPPCGCTVDGYGTLPEPVVIRFCTLHRAVTKICQLLWEGTEDYGKVSLKWLDQSRKVVRRIYSYAKLPRTTRC